MYFNFLWGQTLIPKWYTGLAVQMQNFIRFAPHFLWGQTLILKRNIGLSLCIFPHPTGFILFQTRIRVCPHRLKKYAGNKYFQSYSNKNYSSKNCCFTGKFSADLFTYNQPCHTNKKCNNRNYQCTNNCHN